MLDDGPFLALYAAAYDPLHNANTDIKFAGDLVALRCRAGAVLNFLPCALARASPEVTRSRIILALKF